MGAGVQTTALLLLHEKIKYDLCIFTDPGSEHPPTYEYIEKYLKPFYDKIGLEWITVKNEKWTLEESLIHYGGPPDTQYRICTNDFKVRPIQKYMRKNYFVSADNPYKLILGISYDEAHRSNMSPRVLYE